MDIIILMSGNKLRILYNLSKKGDLRNIIAHEIFILIKNNVSSTKYIIFQIIDIIHVEIHSFAQLENLN